MRGGHEWGVGRAWGRRGLRDGKCEFQQCNALATEGGGTLSHLLLELLAGLINALQRKQLRIVLAIEVHQRD